MEFQNSFIITDDLRINSFPLNCEITTKTISTETVRILFKSCTKNQVHFRKSECAEIFKQTISEEYNEDNYPRKFIKGDVFIVASYCRGRKTEETENISPYLTYRLGIVE